MGLQRVVHGARPGASPDRNANGRAPLRVPARQRFGLRSVQTAAACRLAVVLARRNDVPVSMMCASKVSRSTMAWQSRLSMKVWSHSVNGLFEAIAIACGSSRSVKFWKSSQRRAGRGDAASTTACAAQGGDRRTPSPAPPGREGPRVRAS